MEVVAPAPSVTLRDRFVAAYYAFRMSVKPDVQAVMDRLDAIQREREAKAAARQTVLDRMDGYDKAIVLSVASGTGNSELLVKQVMPVIEKMSDDDQLTVIKHIITGNPSAARYPEISSWIRNNIRDVFANLQE